MNHKFLKEKKRYLRNHATPAEAVLWKLLKGRQLEGYKFRRQHSIGNYIVDFYCTELRLAVELDGLWHKDEIQEIKDNERTKYLESQGVTLIRIGNRALFANTGMAIDRIATTIKELKKHKETKS